MRVVRRYGTMWARNKTNLKNIPKGKGVYVLFDGSMPMYVGKGRIGSRIRAASRSERRKNLWDHFSWYTIKNPAMMHDIEALMLRILPPNLRSLTRQGGDFVKADEIPEPGSEQAIRISRVSVRKSKA
jgi:hypothetical protein